MEVRGNITGVPGGLYGPGNLAATDAGLHPHWARITGRASGTNRYAHEQVDDGDAPDFAGNLGAAFGVAGTSDATGYPAYEVNGRTDVPTDGSAVVRVYPSGDLSYLTFQYGEAAPPATDCDADACDDLVGLKDDWCLKLSILCHEGEFSGMDEEQFAAVFGWHEEFAPGVFGWVFYVWDSGTSAWVEFDMDWIGGSGGVVLTFDADGKPVLTVDDTLELFYKPCVGGGKFTGGPRNGFTGDVSPVELCAPNVFVLKVECSCCPIDGWQGPDRTYCILVSGDCETGEKACAVLTEEDACDTDITICSGTYEDEASCELVCDPPTSVVTGCCEAPSTITLTMVTFATGSCDLVWNGSLWAGSGSFTVDTCGAKTIHWELRCNGGSLSSFEIRHSCDAGANWSSWIAVSVGVSCNPIDGLNSEYTLTTAAGCETCVAPEFSLTGSF